MTSGIGATDARNSVALTDGSSASFFVIHDVKSDQRQAISEISGSPIVITPDTHSWLAVAAAATTAIPAPSDTPESTVGGTSRPRARRKRASSAKSPWMSAGVRCAVFVVKADRY